jgi:hypothetical protein
MSAFVRGRHQYLIPVLPGRGPNGLGRAGRPWPAQAIEVTPAEAARAEVDVVVLQRPQEVHGLAEQWLGGRRPGRDLPAVYLEHNAPQGRLAAMRHVAADRRDLVLVHCTHFNDLFWDAGATPTGVIEHGVVDPGYRYRGTLARAAVVSNQAQRRWRVTGTDLLAAFAAALPVDLFGIDAERVAVEGVRPCGDLPLGRLHAAMARRRVYLHPVRWTSLGLSLLEAMHLGMPVVALATTEVVEAVPRDAGIVSTNVEALTTALRELGEDPERARVMGKHARAAALARYGLERFLDDWDRLLAEVTR